MSTDLDLARTALAAKLQKAVALELATLPPYLTALWSLHPGSNLPAAAIIRSVMMEEMLHMTLAGNVLSAVGGSVQLAGSSLPAYPLTIELDSSTEGSRFIHIHLEKFSPGSLQTFLDIELPEHMRAPAVGAARPELEIPDFSVGEFYADIVAEMRRLCGEFGEAALFVGNPSHQISQEFYWKGGGHPIVVQGLAAAEEALKVIAAQGSGLDGSLFDGDNRFFGQPEELAHYFRFSQIQMERYYASGDTIGRPTGEHLPVDFNAVFPIKPDCGHADFAAGSRLQTLSGKFNAAYSMMLWQLMEGFNGNPAVFYTAIMNGMTGLGDVARLMVATAIPDDPEGRHASPTFEWSQAAIG